MKKNYYDHPTMVKFVDTFEYDPEEHIGIAYHNEIICACCGSTFEITDECIENIEELNWVDFSDFIS